ncbi:hypothetical protein [Bacillus sp. JJ722]|uniref:hypothetical protein n=1 Tax=Bacillus sp. JJ722 TaxID=3122973 RepID=UPI002FFE9AA8
MKKFIITTLGALLLFALSAVTTVTIASASEPEENTYITDVNVLDQTLINHGFPERLVADLPLIQKEDLVNSGEIGEYVGATTTTFDTNNRISSVEDYTSLPKPLLKGTINSMKVTQLVTKVPSTTGKDRFLLETVHQWTISPVNRRTDVVGFAWDGNRFKLIPGSHKVVVGGNGQDGAATYTSLNLYSSSFTGAGWSFPLPKSGTRPVVMTRINLEETKTGSGTSQFHSLYTHTKSGSGSIGLNFGILSVGFTGSVSNDQRAVVKDFKY